MNNILLHETYMQRCLQLARFAAGAVAPNPMVGSVLVYNDRIIGEGYHMQYGKAHAEVNCINSVPPTDQHFIPDSVIYVSLEPCAHFGKTPPCADLIIKHRIKKVVIGCRDPFDEVNGKGIEKLKAAGIEVEVGVLEQACMDLNKSFFTFHTKHRPYIILKWAQSADGIMGAAVQPSATHRVLISNAITNRLVHKWRSEVAAILIGTETLKVFDRTVPTMVFNDLQSSETEGLTYYDMEGAENFLEKVCEVLYKKNINSLLVEGGSRLLQSFINAGLWDEARIITNRNLLLKEGVKVPVLNVGTIVNRQRFLEDGLVTVVR